MKRFITILLIGMILIAFVISPIATVVAYELIFDKRYETKNYLQYTVEDFDGLMMERSDFESDGLCLAGYKYSKKCENIKGLVIVAHGLGGGGHNAYLPFIDYFTSNGYYVFSYDARGNDNSEGTVSGLPMGIISLDSAIDHAKSITEYQGLPIALFGHSWGGYSVGNVLNIHPEIKAAVIIAGFNESEDMLKYQGEKYAGDKLGLLLPYLKIYERFKFGTKFADISAIDGFANTNASIMIVHSMDDATVPTRFGYDKFYEEYKDNERFKFILYEDRGHTYLMYSAEALEYSEKLYAEYEKYLTTIGKNDTNEVKAEFMSAHLDKEKCYEPNSELMAEIISLFDEYCM